MDVLIQSGIDWIIAIQSLGSWLELPMEIFTFLGNENFFFLVLPLIYWSIDAGAGLKVAFILATSNYLNAIVKVLFVAPRPYWVSSQVEPLSLEHTFGIPSGHAQNSAAIWGTMPKMSSASQGSMMVMPGTPRISAMSSVAWWLGP